MSISFVPDVFWLGLFRCLPNLYLMIRRAATYFQLDVCWGNNYIGISRDRVLDSNCVKKCHDLKMYIVLLLYPSPSYTIFKMFQTPLLIKKTVCRNSLCSLNEIANQNPTTISTNSQMLFHVLFNTSN